MSENKLPSYMQLFQENANLKKELEKLKQQIVDVPPTKGVSGLEIEKEGNVWIIREHRKVNREGEIKIIETKVSHKSVTVLWGFILGFCENIGDKVSYEQLVPTIIATYNLGITPDAFNGGKNRKHYFKIYQYPSKILHYMKYTHYSLKGVHTRLR